MTSTPCVEPESRTADSGLTEAVLCIGSNSPQGGDLIARAISQLRLLAPMEATPPYPSGGGYTNCVARMACPASLAELTALTKRIELQLGRTPQARAEGRVPVDIDVVTYGGETVRPADAAKTYFTIGYEMLKNTNRFPA